MPQLEQTYTFASQIFWLAITFGTLFYVMWKIALPKVAEVLDARQQRLENDLDKARALKNESAEVLAVYEAALAEARGSAHKEIAEAAGQVAEAAAAEQQALSARLAEQAAEAEERIAKARDDAMGNVRAVAVEVSRAALTQLAGETTSDVEDSQIDGAVDGAMRG